MLLLRACCSYPDGYFEVPCLPPTAIICLNRSIDRNFIALKRTAASQGKAAASTVGYIQIFRGGSKLGGWVISALPRKNNFKERLWARFMTRRKGNVQCTKS